MINKKLWLDIFSFVFIIVALYFVLKYLSANKLLSVPSTIQWTWLISSIVFLLAGFLINCLSWQLILRNNGIVISFKDSILSLGMSIFGKYIPGKVWLITGISGKVAAASGSSVFVVAMVATLLQILVIGMGVLVGMFSINAQINFVYRLVIYILFIVGIALFFKYKNRIYENRLICSNKLTRRWVRPLIKSISTPLLMSILGVWLLWSLAFYLFCLSLGANLINYRAGFTFPLASSGGIVAIFAPGGIGVREGLLGLLLSEYIGSKADVVSIATFSRLWFLVGEAGIFSIAVILQLLSWIRLRKSRLQKNIE
ncbi:MAG: lysylphosphatidylglycerol synthase domain-containing protein [Candidatus Cloacimonadaceae bacterium]|nr:lysylphosphatidylglycerol synthase domain-containing protein [Candidatus Cloacimonadota bacterium]MDY0326120.1 lysylphosphatidylglycerol synthase domain-containing protein [Candidatus Cloacimonadaceae bacterium]